MDLKCLAEIVVCIIFALNINMKSSINKCSLNLIMKSHLEVRKNELLHLMIESGEF